jgi:hypothetical protein
MPASPSTNSASCSDQFYPFKSSPSHRRAIAFDQCRVRLSSSTVHAPHDPSQLRPIDSSRGASAAPHGREEAVRLSLTVLSGVEGMRSERTRRRRRDLAPAYKQPAVSFKPESRRPESGVRACMFSSDMRNPLWGSMVVSGRPFCAEAGCVGRACEVERPPALFSHAVEESEAFGACIYKPGRRGLRVRGARSQLTPGGCHAQA